MLALLLALTLAAPAPGEPLPEAPLRAPTGEAASLGAFAGRVHVVNLWASWCAPCLAELPALDALNGRLAAQGAAVVAVSVDRRERDALAVVKHLGLTLPVLLDPDNALVARLDPAGLPTTLLVDADGRVVQVHSGALSADDVAALEVRALALIAGKAP